MAISDASSRTSNTGHGSCEDDAENIRNGRGTSVELAVVPDPYVNAKRVAEDTVAKGRVEDPRGSRY